MAKYAIKVDYYHCDDFESGMYTVPCYLYTDRSGMKLLIFDPTLQRNDLDLRLFDSRDEAEQYISKHGWDKSEQCCFENPRVVKIECLEVKA